MQPGNDISTSENKNYASRDYCGKLKSCINFHSLFSDKIEKMGYWFEGYISRLRYLNLEFEIHYQAGIFLTVEGLYFLVFIAWITSLTLAATSRGRLLKL